MSREELSSTLASLHETLNDTTDVDDKTRELLMSVTADIQRLLTRDDDSTETETSEETEEPFSDRIQDMIVEFEVKHPHIGGLLERLSDGLAQMGI